ncbi:CPBP family intramembrane glutamic endopeptidase [Streptomyces zingiberis]|uniref:CPBP family intramembrane metalloprotease n=1 Tax=Streptomyces zingiberis TaxID=2053010 RepID=A0ABX1BVV2_9ACTN|nr:CPBP family intramembrane glutamic endopeptidase [Streptomyces zingiberis]NJP99871.1 CPBP family intramembrane metalloprotease [Streptomyces zingiberis]
MSTSPPGGTHPNDHAPRFTYADMALVLLVGVGLANSAVADFLARGPAHLGLSGTAAASIAWFLINGVQVTVGLLVVRHRFGAIRRPLLLIRPARGQVGAAIGWGLAKAALTLGLVLALPAALTEGGGGEGGHPAGSLPAQFAFAFAFGALASPFYEEVLYRGVFYQGLAARLPAVTAVVLSAGVFALVHLPRVFNTISALFAGLLFAWLLHRHRNLWVPILAHAVSNGTLVVLAFAAEAAG